MNNNKARSFVTIMIVVAVASLLLRIAIEEVIKLNIEQNESQAQITLKLISTALENYAKDNQGTFPSKFSALFQKTEFPYLDKDYISQSPVKGYNYSCSRIDSSGYNCFTAPLKCGLTGQTIYTITTGGSLISEKCDKKE